MNKTFRILLAAIFVFVWIRFTNEMSISLHFLMTLLLLGVILGPALIRRLNGR